MFTIDQFPKDPKSPDGRGNVCRKCRTADMRRWRAEQPLRVQRHREEMLLTHGSDYFTKKKKAWLVAKPWRLWSTRAREALRSRNVDVTELSREEIEIIAEKAENCPICGRVLDWDSGASRRGTPPPDVPVLDRPYLDEVVDPSRVWVICQGCYTLKGGMEFPAFVAYCVSVADSFREWLSQISEKRETGSK